MLSIRDMRHQGRYMITAGTFPEPGQELRLQGREARHLITVRRARPGDTLELFDGRGNSWQALFAGCEAGTAVCSVQQVLPPGANGLWELTLASAVPRPKRMSFLVEKCAELGVGQLIPVKWKHSPRLGKDSAALRWGRIAESAAKQSGRAMLMQVADPVGAAELLPLIDCFDHVLLLDTAGGLAPGEALAGAGQGDRILALVGPEGGFEASELRSLRDASGNRYRPVTLGPATLRVETACIAIASTLLCEGLGRAARAPG